MHLQSILLLALLTPFASGAPFFDLLQGILSPGGSSQGDNVSGNPLSEKSGSEVFGQISGFLNQLLSSLDGFQNQGTAESPSALSSSQGSQSPAGNFLNEFIGMLFGGGSNSRNAIRPESAYPSSSTKAVTQSAQPVQKEPAQGAIAPPSSNTGSGDMSRCLSLHNQFRSAGGSPNLVWDAGLAASAQAWANNLVGRPGLSLSHSRNGNGENLYGGMGGSNTCDSAVTAWHNEKPLYRGQPIGGFGFSAYGHYTQLMWKSTEKLGCAAARSGSKVIYVCQYFPAGNRVGTTLANS